MAKTTIDVHAQSKKGREKRTYEAPTLVKHGTVSSVTLLGLPSAPQR